MPVRPGARQVRGLPELDLDHRRVGIVSLGDLAVSAHEERRVGEALEGISEPAVPVR